MWGKHASADPEQQPADSARQTAERVAAANAAALLALLERPKRADTQILRSYLEGSSWVESFERWCDPREFREARCRPPALRCDWPWPHLFF